MQDLGATAVVAEGMEGGGHIGKMCTFPMVRQVAEAVDIPVIAAGGIADGKGFMAALMLGAVCVQMGTAFLVAEDCPISDVSTQSVGAASDRDTVLTGESGKKQARASRAPGPKNTGNCMTQAHRAKSSISSVVEPLQLHAMASSSAGRFPLA